MVTYYQSLNSPSVKRLKRSEKDKIRKSCKSFKTCEFAKKWDVCQDCGRLRKEFK